VTIVVRVFADGHGGLKGVVERPRTGERRPLPNLDALPRVIVELLGPSAGRREP
jgi:hypothetical protein